VRCRSAVIDGEICCLEWDGRTNFYDLLFRREQPYFYAFDLLMLNGEDLRGLPLTQRKRRLAAIMTERTWLQPASRLHSLLHLGARRISASRNLP